MIQANELRIGNYLQDRDGSLCRVEGISKEVNKEIDAPVVGSARTALPHKPIPLTEEWLIKFGFTKEDGRCVWIMKLPDFDATLQQWGDNKEISVCRSGIAAYHVASNYVHQLQNLYFALTGKELELKK